MRRALWSVALAVALFWPARALSMFDGLPLDGAAEAIVLGVAVPFLWVVHRRFLDARWVHVAIAVLLGIKIVGAFLLTQEGLCARFSTGAPFHANVLTIPVDEPRGMLRSWDVRADWRGDAPLCTAIIDRPYPMLSAMPVWFLNVTDFVVGSDDPKRKGAAPRDIAMDVRGALRVSDAGLFAIDLDRDMTLSGAIGSQTVTASGGAPVAVTLGPGVHSLALHVALTGDRWKFVPTWNGRSAFDAARMTVDPPQSIDRWFAPAVQYGTFGAVVLLVAGWTWSLVAPYRGSPFVVAWTVAASALLIAVGMSGRLERFAGAALVASPFVPLTAAHRTWRGALLLFGVPWLAFFVARSIPQIGHISPYSVDDWLAYQVAGYRIYLNGFWLEGGSRAFDYQPLYRWISGALHLVFGDSSVGEVYWDVVCLLAGAFVAFALVKPIGGFRWAVGAAAATLATFTVSTIWYFVGRGLSEIAAAGFAFFAALSLLNGARGGFITPWCPPSGGPEGRLKPAATGYETASNRRAIAVGAGVLAICAFYTRENHLVFAPLLVVLMLPLDVPAAWRRVWPAVRRVDRQAALAYVATFVTGVVMFAVRTWWYTGVFSVFYGTSLKYNDTGLRPSTIGSLEVWRRIAHSLSALVWMNEPPHADPRAVVVAAGALLSVLALAQLPRLNRLPFSIAVVTIGAGVSSLFAHAHGYPGRMSIHLVPFAVAMAVVAMAVAVRLGGEPARSAAAADIPV